MTDPNDRSKTAPRGPVDARLADQDHTLLAAHRLEAALGEAAPGRERTWAAAVLTALVALDDATRHEFENAERPDSLLSDIRRTQPGLRTRVRGLRRQYTQLRDAIGAIRRELEGDGQVDYADIRQRLSWILTALRHERAREADLVYEAYYDAFRVHLSSETASNG